LPIEDDFQSRAVGVGRKLFGGLPPDRIATDFVLLAIGVGSQARQPGCFIIDGESWLPVSVGVANQPEPISDMRGANCGSRYNLPFRIIPDLGQVSENASHPETKQAWDVLHDDEARS
jgi:hypothetical protein